jgi:DNA repair exonuclease SbcCD ATPase subunit
LAAETVLQPSGDEAGAVATIRQVRLQASQLAAHLKRQQATVDHREAELNARLAAMEKEIRGARLWLNERHEELAARQAELDRRERELEVRAAEIGPSRNAPPCPAPRDAQDYDEREAELAQREAELDAVARRLAESGGRGASGDDEIRALAARRENLDRLQQLLESERARLAQERQRLDDERATLVESLEAERQRAAEERQRASTEHEHARRELARQCDEVAARHAALEKLRADVFKWQQEALETRLATEELWSRLCGSMAPAALARSLAQIRLRLAENGSLARAELAQQKA